jgi:ABC-type phosphate transport system substrate-binding protein
MASRTLRVWSRGGIALLLASLALRSVLLAQEAGYKVIVHESNPLTSISAGDLSKVFLKKVSHWSNNNPARPVDLPDSSPVREKFSRDIHKKALSAVLAYWQQQIFSGSGLPPAEKGNDAQVMEYVKENPGAVGYVSASATLANGLKVMKVTP